MMLRKGCNREWASKLTEPQSSRIQCSRETRVDPVWFVRFVSRTETRLGVALKIKLFRTYLNEEIGIMHRCETFQERPHGR